MNMFVSKFELQDLVCRQLNNFFTLSDEDKSEITNVLDIVLNRCSVNFSASENKYISRGFTPYHSVMYMIFLYYLSNEIYKRNICEGLCDKIYYLNKIMHSVDLFYAIDLPSRFGAEHPLGAVMGRAKYSDGFFFYQGCTVGGTDDKNGNVHYPVIGENCHMFSNSCILGKSSIGRNVNIGAGAIVRYSENLLI